MEVGGLLEDREGQPYRVSIGQAGAGEEHHFIKQSFGSMEVCSSDVDRHETSGSQPWLHIITLRTFKSRKPESSFQDSEVGWTQVPQFMKLP